jgi:hypothetical protein
LFGLNAPPSRESTPSTPNVRAVLPHFASDPSPRAWSALVAQQREAEDALFAVLANDPHLLDPADSVLAARVTL